MQRPSPKFLLRQTDCFLPSFELSASSTEPLNVCNDLSKSGVKEGTIKKHSRRFDGGKLPNQNNSSNTEQCSIYKQKNGFFDGEINVFWC
jgi:hypothetical protein